MATAEEDLYIEWPKQVLCFNLIDFDPLVRLECRHFGITKENKDYILKSELYM